MPPSTLRGLRFESHCMLCLRFIFAQNQTHSSQEANLSGKKRWRAIINRVILRRRYAQASFSTLVSTFLAARRGLRWAARDECTKAIEIQLGRPRSLGLCQCQEHGVRQGKRLGIPRCPVVAMAIPKLFRCLPEHLAQSSSHDDCCFSTLFRSVIVL